MAYEHHYPEGVAFGPASERAREILMEADREILREMDEMGGVENYLDAHPELLEAFTADKPFLCCMDERTAKGTIHVPGSGIGIEGDVAQQAFKDRLKDAEVQGVYSHDGCGAAKIFAEKHGITDFNEAAIQYAQDLAAKLGIPYSGHLKTSGEHPGRAVYYDATGTLDKGNKIWQEKMPTGFAVSRNVLGQHEALEALVLAVQIALGDHGPGAGRFTKEDPLTLMSIGFEPSAQSLSYITDKENLQSELQLCYERIIETYPDARDRIKIQGFSIPRKESRPVEEEIDLDIAA